MSKGYNPEYHKNSIPYVIWDIITIYSGAIKMDSLDYNMALYFKETNGGHKTELSEIELMIEEIIIDIKAKKEKNPENYLDESCDLSTEKYRNLSMLDNSYKFDSQGKLKPKYSHLLSKNYYKWLENQKGK